jgi:signal transduction histidine kinase
VNDVLDFSQIRLGKLKKNINGFNLKQALEEIVSMQLDQAMGKNISIEILYQPNQQEAFVLSDMRRFQQVFLNILSNAIKFTRKHGLIQIIPKL